jgi:recombination protein RecA
MTTAEEIAKEINEMLGSNTVIFGNDKRLKVEYIKTGVLPIDHLLSGGIPKGRFTELFGAYSTLKSYIGLSTIAQAQKSGGVCALIDTEHAYDPEWARSLGVDTDSLIYQAPDTGEEAIDTSETLIRMGVDLIVWDSVAATLPQAESNKRMSKESVQPARLAALMSLGMRKLTSANRHTAMMFINQTRMSVGVMFGDPEVVAGGKALPYYASYRVSLRKAGKVKEVLDGFDDEGHKTKINSITGIKIRATLEKSKLSAPSREAIFTFDLSKGRVDEIGYLISCGLLNKTIKHEGRSWWIDENEKQVGLEKFRGYLEANPQMQETIKASLIPKQDGKQELVKKKEGKQKKQ